MNIIKKVFFLLAPSERRQAYLLLLMILIMAILDMIGVASILPFIAVLTNPSLIETNLMLNSIYKVSFIFGIENKQQFLFTLGILVFVLLVISLTFKAITTYVQVRFIQMQEYTIGKRLVEGYLHQPYSWFLNRHSADLGKTILSEVATVIGGCIFPLLDLISKSLVTIALITLLILADPKIALFVGFGLGSIYGCIFFFLRSFLKRIGKERLKNNQMRFTAVIEAFGASKEIKVAGLEQSYIKRFSIAAQNFAKYQALSQVIGQIPRFFLEAIAFGGVMLSILYLMNETGSFINSLPIISLYIFAGYRLMPAAQQIYTAFTQISFNSQSIDQLNKDIKNLKPFNSKEKQGALEFNKKIVLNNVHYNYPNSSRTALKNINIEIPAKAKIGIVGTTGSGKTTTIDIILGLLEPQKGNLEVDGQIITKQNSRAWQQSIGYVPQQIYLADETIAGNIAFGLDLKDINKEALEKASKIANLHEFVMNELPDKYQTTVGERGVRLSGGQRQRIGIARALYHNPKVLILDEATSALDNQTEQAVMDAVNNIGKDITIILISHRLNTVKNCDIVFKLEKGEVINRVAV